LANGAAPDGNGDREVEEIVEISGGAL
jgi:hypothetical protein